MRQTRNLELLFAFSLSVLENGCIMGEEQVLLKITVAIMYWIFITRDLCRYFCLLYVSSSINLLKDIVCQAQF